MVIKGGRGMECGCGLRGMGIVRRLRGRIWKALSFSSLSVWFRFWFESLKMRVRVWVYVGFSCGDSWVSIFRSVVICFFGLFTFVIYLFGFGVVERGCGV